MLIPMFEFEGTVWSCVAMTQGWTTATMLLDYWVTSGPALPPAGDGPRLGERKCRCPPLPKEGKNDVSQEAGRDRGRTFRPGASGVTFQGTWQSVLPRS